MFTVHDTCLTDDRSSARYDHLHHWSLQPHTGFDDHDGTGPALLPCIFHWLRQELGQPIWEETSYILQIG